MARTRLKRFALDLGASSVKACELVHTSSGLEVTKFAHISLGIDPSMPPEEKEALKQEGIARAIKAGNFKHKRVILAVPGQSVFVRNRLLPPVQESRLTQIVQYEIQQQIPFPLDQIALDYQVIKRTETKEYDVMMTAIKVDTVDSFAKVILDAKLKVDTVDIVPVATYTWLRRCGELSKEEGETVACLDIGASTTDIFIERDGEFRFTRSLTIAGNHVTAAIQEALGVPFEEAERLKMSVGQAPLGAESGSDAESDEGRVAQAVAGVLDRLAHEVNRSFGFFRTQSGGSPVARVVISGGSAGIRNIERYLSERLEVPVAAANPFKNLSIAQSAAAAQSARHLMSTCLGLAVRGLEPCPLDINLIPPRIIQAEKTKERSIYWGLSFFTLLLILLAFIPIQEQKHRLNEQMIVNLDVEINAYGDHSEDAKMLRSQIDSFEQKYNALNDLAGGGKRWTWLAPLDVLCKTLPPEGVWLENVQTWKMEGSLKDQIAETTPSGGGGDPFGGMMGGGMMGGGMMGGGMMGGGMMGGGMMGGGMMGGGMMGGMMGGGMMPFGGGGKSDVADDITANAFRITAFARTLEHIEQFKATLERESLFEEVHVYETMISEVDELSLQGVGSGGSPFGGGGGGGMMDLMTGGMGGGREASAILADDPDVTPLKKNSEA